MAFKCYVTKRLDIEVDGDEYPTVILGLKGYDDEDTKKVYQLQQTEGMTELGIAIRPYGLVVIPNRNNSSTQLVFSWKDEEGTIINTPQHSMYDMKVGVDLNYQE